ncbi:hypothetical protein Y032_0019g3896 [Ancylostoma ceylanicum]|uniref:Uncharacterized protein n=1 Tax=Ancylostoma ceylanicum TaxID=53326 RepID=A0A016V2B1_9BILA|nr:hypothetical protein Y032_0019g3896 [Ancylostoma ceylanicum]
MTKARTPIDGTPLADAQNNDFPCFFNILRLFKRRYSTTFSFICMTGIVILCVVLVAITVVFFGCYLLLRFMHRALGADDRKQSSPYSNVVIHSKRVYEIQAEEGCFNYPPDIHEAVEDPPKSTTSEDRRSNGSSPSGSPRGSMKRPETGDLKTMRQEFSEPDDPRQLIRKKERKVHKDSVCAFLFKPEPQPKMI